MLAALLATVLSVGAVAPRKSTALSPAQQLLAGGSARALSQCVMYPADAMRTLAQTRAGAKTLQELGAKTLISGCATTSCFAFAVGGIQFATVGTLAPRLGMLSASVCGAVGSCLASVPQEVIKQRLVTGIYPSFRVAVATIAKSEGLQGFYTAWLPTMTRNVPYVTLTFCSFEALRRKRLGSSGREGTSLTNAESLQFGILAALAAGFITQPVSPRRLRVAVLPLREGSHAEHPCPNAAPQVDVVKTRLMTQAAAVGAKPYEGVLDCVSTMYTTEGLGAFYSGLRQRSLYMGPLWVSGAALPRFTKAASLTPEHTDRSPTFLRERRRTLVTRTSCQPYMYGDPPRSTSCRLRSVP